MTTHSDIDTDILNLFEREFVESKSLSKPLSLEDKRVLANGEQNVKLVDGHYQVPVPWEVDWKNLPDSRFVAERRLCSLKSRFLKDASMVRQYTEIFSEYEKKVI